MPEPTGIKTLRHIKNVLLSPILNWFSKDKKNISFLKQNTKKYEQRNFI